MTAITEFASFEVQGNVGVTVLPMTAPDEAAWEQQAISLHRRVDGSYGTEKDEAKSPGREMVRAD